MKIRAYKAEWSREDERRARDAVRRLRKGALDSKKPKPSSPSSWRVAWTLWTGVAANAMTMMRDEYDQTSRASTLRGLFTMHLPLFATWAKSQSVVPGGGDIVVTRDVVDAMSKEAANPRAFARLVQKTATPRTGNARAKARTSSSDPGGGVATVRAKDAFDFFHVVMDARADAATWSARAAAFDGDAKWNHASYKSTHSKVAAATSEEGWDRGGRSFASSSDESFPSERKG